jgi:TRAP-type C4-dicarboxylate transport system permease small subunit
MKVFIRKLSGVLEKAAGVLCATILAGLCLIIVYSVIMRSIFNSPVTWQYELTLVGLCWVTFIGMSMTFSREEHLRLTFVSNKLRPKAWQIYMDVIDLLLIAFLVAGIICSFSIIKSTWGTYYKTIPIRNGVYYLSFPIGCAFSIVHLIRLIMDRKPEDAPTAQEAKEGTA